MNIAIFFTGQIRLNHDVFNNLNSFLKHLRHHNIDLFCTTWYEDNFDYQNIKNQFDFKILDIETYSEYFEGLVLNAKNFKQFCLDYKNDNYDYLNNSFASWRDKSWKSTPINFYKLKRGFDLIKEYSIINNVKYDIVIRIRWDCFLRGSVIEEQINEIFKNNKLCVFQHDYNVFKKSGSMNSDLHHKYIHGWVDDLIYISNFDTFEKLSRIYYFYYDISVKYNTWIIHLILQKYLQECNIQTLMPKFRISLKRKDSTIDIFDYLFV